MMKYLQKVCLQLGNLLLTLQDLCLQAGLVLLHSAYLGILVLKCRRHAGFLDCQQLTLQCILIQLSQLSTAHTALHSQLAFSNVSSSHCNVFSVRWAAMSQDTVQELNMPYLLKHEHAGFLARQQLTLQCLLNQVGNCVTRCCAGAKHALSTQT